MNDTSPKRDPRNYSRTAVTAWFVVGIVVGFGIAVNWALWMIHD